MKKIISILSLLLIILMLLITPVEAAFEIIVNEKGSEITLDDNQGKLSKKIIETNEKEIVIEINLSNTGEEEIQQSEILFVIDNSTSMSTQVGSAGKRKQIIMDAAINLTRKIFDQINNVKVGAIKFSTKDNVTLIQELTENENQIINSLTQFSSQPTEGNTNIEAGMIAAQNKFTQTADNKIIILLTDGIPTDDYAGNKDSNQIIANTKKSLKKEGIYTVSVLTGVTADVEKIFGTSQNPTANEFYNIQDKDITTTIQENIYENIVTNIKKVMRQIEIIDYFPQEIIDNFIIEYINQPTKGEVTQLDEEDRSFTWNIEKLEQNEQAIIKYKLILKEENNKNILDQIQNTNEKVVIKYTNKDNEEKTKEITQNPSVEITEKVEENNNVITNEIENENINNTINNTEKENKNIVNNNKSTGNNIAPGKLPAAGGENIILIIVAIMIITSIIAKIKYKKIK